MTMECLGVVIQMHLSAWENIFILCKGEKAHNTSSGDLAETDEDNAKVFAKHFGKLMNNKKGINDNVLNNINSCEVMNELDVPPSWK